MYWKIIVKTTSLLLIICCTSWVITCKKHGGNFPPGTNTIVFKHGKIGGVAENFQRILAQFEDRYPGIKVKDEVLPASTDTQHQFYVINLESKSSDFDVLSMDVIWVPEFARSGWIEELTHLMPVSERGKFFKGPVEAVTYKTKIYAIPWYIDAGVMYYRKDLLEKYGFKPPVTWDELIKISKTIVDKEKNLYGFLWQGKQYEGLVCNVLEFIWGNGGSILRNGKVELDTPQNAEALQLMYDLIHRYRISPELVTTAIEETTRHIFSNGKAVFMRNWPYAWNIFQQPGSLVQGKVGVCMLPSFRGKTPASTLGGWQLGINRFSRKKKLAEKLVTFLASPQIQKQMALTVGYKPTLKALYQDPDIKHEQPFMVMLYDVFMTANARPVTPRYMAITQVLQSEFSAAINGLKTPESALESAQVQVEKILRE